ncbi:MAG: Asp-tRNA(Asn)/Glu-tRNA(Gln) amidotransferase subunit GatB [Bacteroidota bacterium]|nr:Asp-tRNA(Asn)/Glu-tRNA(Gln) amidotransferase subunit GatB [Bacteroidota bacterium]
MNDSNGYEAVIGLEVHIQLTTRTKAFCGCSTRFGDAPNTNTCPVCLGYPGALPVANREMISMAIALGLATGCTIHHRSVFVRKHYFYPDLPKGYQISQYEDPICTDGTVDIELDDGTRKPVRIRRIHIEEDAGKSLHDIATETLIDLNRCGVPLLEIVTEPDLRTPAEAHAFLVLLRKIVTYLEICDGNMEEGSLRCDANVSVRPAGSREMRTKTEIKNLNSFRNVERALGYEIHRHAELLRQGESPESETLLWDAVRNLTVPLRGKEESPDYRYFPEPDLPPVVLDDAWIERVRAALPELPLARRDRFIANYGLSRYDADILTAEKPLADFFEHTVAGLKRRLPEDFKTACNWVTGDFTRMLRERKRPITDPPLSPAALAELLDMLIEGTISGKMAKQILEEAADTGVHPREIVGRSGAAQLTDEGFLSTLIDSVLRENEPSVRKYLGGRENVFGFFVGQVMKATQGRANPELVNRILREKLDERKKCHE